MVTQHNLTMKCYVKFFAMTKEVTCDYRKTYAINIITYNIVMCSP